MAGEQTLAVELLALMSLQTARSVSKHQTIVQPRPLVAGLMAYGILSVVSRISPAAARMADIMGAVILLGYLLTWTAKTKTGVKNALELPGKIAAGTLPKTPEPDNYGSGLNILEAMSSFITGALTGKASSELSGVGALQNLWHSLFGGGAPAPAQPKTSKAISTTPTTPTTPGTTSGALGVPSTTSGLTLT